MQETIDFSMELWGLKAVNGPFNHSIDFSPEHRSMVRRYREDLAHLELFDAEALNSLGREILRRRRPYMARDGDGRWFCYRMRFEVYGGFLSHGGTQNDGF